MIDLVVFLLGPFSLLFCFLSQYKVFQAHHYEIGKYYKHNKGKKFLILIIDICFLSIFFFVNLLDKIILIVFLLIINNALFVEKGNLRITKRIIRIIILYFLVSYLVFFIPVENLYILMFETSFFILYLSFIHFISVFVEKMIMVYCVKKAKGIIANKKVIGITGSYGKTSCKNIIYDMVSNIVEISKTPKSFNNKVGIVKSIRECVDKEDKYFICEYGVDKKGGMNKLLKIIKPNISLVTEIGPQHILTFRSIENIKKEKLKIVNILKENESAIINNDNIYLNESKDDLKCNVITYGIKNQSDIMAKNIIMSNKGSSFDLYINDKKYKNIKLCLLGEHNIMNFLGAVGVIKCMGISLNKINNMASSIKPVEHRLELKVLQGIKVIDDGFNANEVGFKKAVDVLNLMKEEKYIITPGIIEQGENSEIINYELGKYMANKIDFAILVEENARVIKKGLLANGFEENRIIVKKDFLEAWEYVKKINSENKIFLIENDLPSIYLK